MSLPRSRLTGRCHCPPADEAPQSPMLNRIAGLGVGEPATETALDEALAAIGGDVACYVSVAPGARPDALTGWLRDRGLEPGWGWMSFRRGLADLPAVSTSLRVVKVATGGGLGLRHRRCHRVRTTRCGRSLGGEGTHGRLGLLARVGWRGAGRSGRCFHRRERRLHRLCRHDARAPGEGWPECPPRDAHPPRTRGRVRHSGDRNG